MTVDIPTRPAEQQAPEPPRRGMRGGPQITLGRSRSVGKAPLVVGGQPRANLLPPEIILKRQQLKTRRALRAGVLLVAVVTAAACAGTFGISSVAQVQFAGAQQAQQALVLEQAKYSEVTDVQTTIATIEAGQRVGTSTEINLRDFLTKLQATLPAGVVVTTVKIEVGTPMAAYQQSTAPLQGERVGGITFSAVSSSLPNIPTWLRSLEKMPGFVDAVPGSVKTGSGGFEAEVLMHIDAGAFSERFDPATVAAAEAAAAAAARSDGTVKSMVAATPATGDSTGGAADGSATDNGEEG
jgi:Tfp pilus assembly protein PilN